MTKFPKLTLGGHESRALAISMGIALLAALLGLTSPRAASAGEVEECLTKTWGFCYNLAWDAEASGECYLAEASACTPSTEKATAIDRGMTELVALSSGPGPVGAYGACCPEKTCKEGSCSSAGCFGPGDECLRGEVRANCSSTGKGTKCEKATKPAQAGTTSLSHSPLGPMKGSVKGCCVYCNDDQPADQEGGNCNHCTDVGSYNACGALRPATCKLDDGLFSCIPAAEPLDDEDVLATLPEGLEMAQCCKECEPGGGPCRVCRPMEPGELTCGRDFSAPASCKVIGGTIVCRAPDKPGGVDLNGPPKLATPEMPEPTLPGAKDAVAPIPSPDSSAGGAGNN